LLCILNKIRTFYRSNPTDDQSARLVRSLRSREQKPKIFLTFLIFLGGGCGGSRQKMERKFLVLLRRFRLLKEQS